MEEEGSLLKSLVSQFQEVAKNVTDNMLLVLDFLRAYELSKDLNFPVCSELLEKIKSLLGHERPDWSKPNNGALVPFNDHVNYGCDLDNAGDLLNYK